MDGSDLEAYLVHAVTLADAVDAVLAGWVVRSVEGRCVDAGRPVDDAVRAAAVAAGERCRAEVAPAIRELLLTDPDDQRTTPLALLRSATRCATEALASLDVPHVVRDEFAEHSFPADVYGLTPASFADVDPALHEPGLTWGAAKAHVHLTRRRAEGRR